MNYKEFIKKYGGDDKITKTDLKDFSALGGSQADAQKFLEKAAEGKKGYEGTVGDKATTYASKDKNFSAPLDLGYDIGVSEGGVFGPEPPSSSSSSSSSSEDKDPVQDTLDDYVGSLEIDYGFLGLLQDDQQAHEIQLAGINNTADYNLGVLENAGKDSVAAIYAGAQTYGYDTEYDIEQLRDARERDLTLYTTQVEDTRLRDFKDKDIAYGLNLQNIINSGLIAVAETQGMYSVSGITERGKYDLEIQKIRSAGDQDIARTNMMGSMMAGFWNSIG